MAKNLAKIWSYSGPGDEPHLLGQVRLVDGEIRFEGFSARFEGSAVFVARHWPLLFG